MNLDTCMSVFKQVQAPFWTPRMKRIFLISKSCNTTAACQKYRHHLNKNQICSRDWYLDWECAECCQGEKCNYYVTLGSDFRKPSLLLITFTALISIAVSSFLRWYALDNSADLQICLPLPFYLKWMFTRQLSYHHNSFYLQFYFMKIYEKMTFFCRMHFALLDFIRLKWCLRWYK